MQELHRDSVHQRYCFSTQKYKQELRLCVMTQTQIKRKTQIDEINGITPLTCSILITRRRVKKQVRAKKPRQPVKNVASYFVSLSFFQSLPFNQLSLWASHRRSHLYRNFLGLLLLCTHAKRILRDRIRLSAIYSRVPDSRWTLHSKITSHLNIWFSQWCLSQNFCFLILL